jgi:hypothetical protein
MSKSSSITVKSRLHSLEDQMQPLEQFVIIEATKQLFETTNQMHEDRTRSKLEPVKTRRDWRQRIARVLVKIAQKLEPDLRAPIHSREAKQ